MELLHPINFIIYESMIKRDHLIYHIIHSIHGG